MVVVKHAVDLRTVRRGTTAVVAQLVGATLEIARLAELGLRSGARIEVLRHGSPCILQLEGTYLCVRLAPSFRILVIPEKVQAAVG